MNGYVGHRGQIKTAGTHDGSPAFFGRRPPTAKSAENCTLATVKDLGDDVYQVNVPGRRWGTAQSIELGITDRPPVSATSSIK